MKHTLFTPGPTNVPPEVLAALGKPIVHHRAPDFEPIFQAAREGLQYVFRTSWPVVPLVSTGTGGMEAAVTSLLLPGDKALVFEAGKFGERWGKICKAFGIDAHVEKVDWGKAPSAALIQEVLGRNPEAKAVFITHCETSTGALTDLESIAKVVGKTDAVLVVDAISSLGAEPLETEKWGVDVVVTGSQKALMMPPGLAFVSISPKAEAIINAKATTNFYFSLKAALKSLAENTTPWTGAVSMIVALNAAVDLLRKAGIENIWARHKRCADAIRKGGDAIGMPLFSESPSNVVVSLNVPEGAEAGKIVKTMRDAFGMTIAGGQDQLKGKVIRIATLGYATEFDATTGICALEIAMNKLGYKFQVGAGIQAALKELMK